LGISFFWFCSNYYGDLYCTVTGSTFDGPHADDINDNLWHQAVYTITGSSQKLYLDGEYKGEANSDPANIGNDTLRIGEMPSGEYPFNGSLDEVRVYNRALSVSEIGDLYRLGQEKIAMSLTNKLTSVSSACGHSTGRTCAWWERAVRPMTARRSVPTTASSPALLRSADERPGAGV